MKTHEDIRKEINNQLEEPRLVVKEMSRERSEHFGQVRVDIFGEIKIENRGWYSLCLNIDPEDLRDALDEVFDTTLFIRDPDLNFSVEVGIAVKSMRFGYDTYEQAWILDIEYEWEEI